uniref:Uncharacterized protein n=1 Tax=Oryza rufipogon TaxID=4529 RepID=A0A0E0RGF1_ORYRU
MGAAAAGDGDGGE